MVTTAERRANKKGRAAKQPLHEQLGLNSETLLDMYHSMALARALDERMWLLNRQGKAAFVISCQGQEAGQIGTAYAMKPGTDWFVPYYRDLALMIAIGQTPRQVMLSLFAKAEEPNSGGRQMPGHYGGRSLKVLTTSSPVGTQYPHAAGIALASKLQKTGEICAVFGGEGSTSQGDWHEAMNFAAIHALPLLFMVENNGFAISVPQKLQMHVAEVSARGAAYGMPGVSVDGLDVLESYKAVKEAADRARNGEGPTLIEFRCIRLTAHSSDDNARTYRTKDEMEAERQMDPVPRFHDYLVANGVLDDEKEAEIRARINAAVNDATDYAEAAPAPRAEDIMKHVYATQEEVTAWRSRL